MASFFPGGLLNPSVNGFTVGGYLAPVSIPDLGGNVVVPPGTTLETRLPENQYPIEQILQQDPTFNISQYSPKTWLNTDSLPPAFFRGSPYKQSGEPQLFILIRADKDITLNPTSSSSESYSAASVGGSEGIFSEGEFISIGDKGETVVRIQEELKRRGFLGGGVDGDFGVATQQAVRDFQESAGLEVDGIVGNLTSSALFIPESIDSPEDREAVRANLDPGGAGIFIPLVNPRVVQTDTAVGNDILATSIVEQQTNLLTTATGASSITLPATVTGRDLESVYTNFYSALWGESSQQAVGQESDGEETFVPPLFLPNLSTITLGGINPPVAPTPPDEEVPAATIPERWEFIVPPNTVSWSKSGEFTSGNPYGANRKYVYYSNTSLRNLSLSEVNLEGFAVGKSVESKIKDLEKCMEIERNPSGFLSPYVWKLYGLGKLYGFFLITSVNVIEVLRDDKGRATRATVSIEMVEVPEYQVYDGRDLARSGDLAKSNFSVCSPGSASGGSFAQNGQLGSGYGAGALSPNGQVTGATAELLYRIRSGEGDYTSINRGVAGDTPGGLPGLTEMSIAQVMALQDRGEAFAVGAYQFIPDTLEGVVSRSGIDPNRKFDKATQDQLALELILGGTKRPELSDYLTGKSNNLDAALSDISYEWASVTGASGRGAYDGDSAGNRASISVADLLPQVREQILSGR